MVNNGRRTTTEIRFDDIEIKIARIETMLKFVAVEIPIAIALINLLVNIF